jgi:hypothetical protein
LVLDEQADELEATELKFEIAASLFQDVAPLSRPLYGWLEVSLVAQLVEDVVHVCKLAL